MSDKSTAIDLCHFSAFQKNVSPPKMDNILVKPWINHSFPPFVSALFFRIMTLVTSCIEGSCFDRSPSTKTMTSRRI